MFYLLYTNLVDIALIFTWIIEYIYAKSSHNYLMNRNDLNHFYNQLELIDLKQM